MDTKTQIKTYIASLDEPKRDDMQTLHKRILKLSPKCQLCFHDGKDEKGKVVSNPTIGYGLQTIKYASGSTREWFQVGLSGNKTGISVYLIGVRDKTHLTRTYGKTLGKASVTGYCIKFKSLKDINIDTLESAIRYGLSDKTQPTG